MLPYDTSLSRSERRSSVAGKLPAILLTALILRLALPAAAWWTVRSPEVFVSPDSPGYLVPAAELLATARYTRDGVPQLFRPPGYSLLLSIGLLLSAPIAVTIGLQALLGTLTVYLVWRIALLASGDEVAATWAAVACAAEPQLVLFSSLLLSETLATAALAVTVWLLLRYLQRPDCGRAAVAGLASASVAYVRAIAYLLPLALALLLGALSLCQRHHRRAGAHALVFLLAAVCLTGAWHVRNGIVAGYWGFSTQFDRALYLLVGGSVRAERDKVSLGDAYERQLGDLQSLDTPGVVGSPETARVMRRHGLEALGVAPVTFIKSYLRGIPVSLLDPGAPVFCGLFGRPPLGLWTAVAEGGMGAALRRLRSLPLGLPLVPIGLGALNLAYLAFAAVGLASGPRRDARPILLLAGIILYFAALSGGPYAVPRYRVPFMPVVSVLAGMGVARLTGSGRARAIAEPLSFRTGTGPEELQARSGRA